MSALIHGALFNISLLLCPGAQNLFLFEHGMVHKRFLLACGLSALCDFILLTIGVFGVGQQLQQNQMVAQCLAVAGAILLTAYGVKSLITEEPSRDQGGTTVSYTHRATILITLSYSLLNPSVYLDTIGLVGVAGALNPYPQNVFFWLGATISSTIWFFAVGFFGKNLSLLFQGKTKCEPLFRKTAGALKIFNAYMLLPISKP